MNLAHSYDDMPAFYDWAMQDRHDDVAFYVNALKDVRGGVLEAGSGTGRITLALAASRIAATGIEINADMLACAREKAARLRSGAEFIAGDMRDFRCGKKFGAALLALNTFSMLDDNGERCACLACLHEHLEDGGGLFMDFVNPLHLTVAGPVTRTYTKDVRPLPSAGAVCQLIVHEKRDPLRQRVDYSHDYVLHYPDGRQTTHRHVFSLNYLHVNELVRLLESAGYTIRAINGDFAGGEYQFTSPLLLIEAGKT